MPKTLTIGVSAEGFGTDRTAEARVRAADEAEPLLRCGQSILLIATTEEKRFLRGEYPNGDIEEFIPTVTNPESSTLLAVDVLSLKVVRLALMDPCNGCAAMFT